MPIFLSEVNFIVLNVTSLELKLKCEYLVTVIESYSSFK